MIETLGAIAVGLCLLIGAGFAFVGSFGLLKLPDSMTRLHAPTKVGTVGIGALLLASVLYNWFFGDGSFHELLILVFLLFTAPISANFIAKVHIHNGTCDAAPKPPRDDTWSTLSTTEPEDPRA